MGLHSGKRLGGSRIDINQADWQYNQDNTKDFKNTKEITPTFLSIFSSYCTTGPDTMRKRDQMLIRCYGSPIRPIHLTTVFIKRHLKLLIRHSYEHMILPSHNA